MRMPLSLVLALILSTACALADEKGKTLSDSERARLKSQVEELKRNKLQDAEQANKNVKSDAVRQGHTIDEKLKHDQKNVEDLAKNSTWMYGPELMRNAAEGRKKVLEQQAKAEKEKVAAEARKKAASHTAAAQKSAEGVNQSIEGLKSQVSKDGKYGLQPKGSSLTVRNYGK